MTASSERTAPNRPHSHGWNALPKYLKAHEGHLDNLRGHFVEADDLRHDYLPPDLLVISGRVWCHHGLFVDVEKTIEIDDRSYARTIAYSYHAGIEGPENRPIFRYDNAHPHEGHEDEHHRHRYDSSTWQEIRPTEWIGYDGWPHLNEVIEELASWWETTGQHLGLADASERDQAPGAGDL